MAWFSRKKKSADSTSDEPDGYLPLMSRGDADLLRAIVHRVLAESGSEPEMFGDHARTTDGSVFGFDNLSRLVRGIADRRAWSDAVRSHFQAMSTSREDPGEDELSELVTTRLFDLGAAGPLSFSYAPIWQEGIVEVLTIDHPDRVDFLAQERVSGLGPLGPWFDRGRANLRRTLEQADVRVERVRADAHWIDCVMSDCVYLASAATSLPDMLSRWVPDLDLRNGVLFAVPFRHQIAFRDCRDGESALAGLMLLPRFAANGFADGVGALSPHVYHWHDGEIRQVTRLRDGVVEVHPGPQLEELLRGVG